MALDKTHFCPQVVQAIAGKNYTVFAYLNDGSIRLVDMKPFIAKGGNLSKLLEDRKFFEERLTVLNETVAWDVKGNRDTYSCIDVDPCEIYECEIVADPLGQHR